MKKYLFIAAIILFVIAGFTKHLVEKQHHIVIQLSSNDTSVWKMTLNNIKNLKIYWGDAVTIEVVAFGPGLDFLLASKTTGQMQITEYEKKGVKFVACENSMNAMKIHKKALVTEAGTVPVG